jgi:hypothetical protein
MPYTKPQAQVIKDKSRFRILISGRRFGKTFLAINELARFARFPSKKVWYVAPTYRQAKSICWTELVQRLRAHNWIEDINNSDLTVTLRNHSKGLSDKEWKSFKFTTLEGMQVPPEEIEQAKDDLDERTFQQEYLASFVNYSGMIYYNFDRSKNLIDNYKKKILTLHIGLDFNVDPMCAVVCVIEKDKIYVIDEIQIWSSNTNEMVDEIKQRYKKNIVIYPDPSARQRKTSAGGMTDLAILKNAGFEVKCKNSAPLVRDRINSVNAKLKNAKGQHSLFILNSCKNVIKSIERQIYKEGTHVPDKDSGYDHFNDALGYMLEYNFPLRRDFKPNPPTRWS